MAMPSEPGELGSFSRMVRPDAVSGEGLGCSVAPLQQQQTPIHVINSQCIGSNAVSGQDAKPYCKTGLGCRVAPLQV
jgi:hypothetical protein